jgi:hypothetical protein
VSKEQPSERLFQAWAEARLDFDPEAGRARFLDTFGRAKHRDGRRRLVVLLAAAAMACCGVLFVWWESAPPLRFTTATGEGRAGAWLATSKADELPLAFSEGSRVVMEPDSRGRVEQLDRTGATFVLERGEVRAKVVHQSAARWTFRAGPFEVQVTGTALGVEWDPTRERFAVHVDEGSVAVRGPNVSAVQVVRAGERCVVDLPSRTMRLSSRAEDTAAEVDASIDGGDDSLATGPSPSSSGASPPRRAAAPLSWTKLEERGDYDAAYAAAVSAGLASVLRASSADELLRLAEVSQLSGHRDTEREALLACRRRYPGTERAAVAAYELGRASGAADAAVWFSAYLREQPTGPLAREASGRLIEARASAGDGRGAREAASEYLSRYRDGPHAALAERVLAGARE